MATSAELLTRMLPWSTKASWAVWAEDDVTFPTVPRGLHTQAVVLTFNRPHEGETPDREPWLNLHTSRRHHDHFLARALRTTPGWGGYLTTLHDVPDDGLARELGTLAARDPLVLLVGGKARDLALRGLDLLAPTLGSTPASLRWVDLPHFSGMAARVHGSSPQRYAELVAWSLAHPRTPRPWTLPDAPRRERSEGAVP